MPNRFLGMEEKMSNIKKHENHYIHISKRVFWITLIGIILFIPWGYNIHKVNQIPELNTWGLALTYCVWFFLSIVLLVLILERYPT